MLMESYLRVSEGFLGASPQTPFWGLTAPSKPLAERNYSFAMGFLALRASGMNLRPYRIFMPGAKKEFYHSLHQTQEGDSWNISPDISKTSKVEKYHIRILHQRNTYHSFTWLDETIAMAIISKYDIPSKQSIQFRWFWIHSIEICRFLFRFFFFFVSIFIFFLIC